MNRFIKNLTLFAGIFIFIVGIGTDCFAKVKYEVISASNGGSDYTRVYTNVSGMTLETNRFGGSVESCMQYKSGWFWVSVPGTKSNLNNKKQHSVVSCNTDYSSGVRGYIKAGWFSSGNANLTVGD